jgi:hypothetical protein
MLTKFAMLFFIIALAFILMGFKANEEEVICSTQAGALARDVAASVNNVVNAPVEDERKVYAFSAGLSMAKEQYYRYEVNLTDRKTSGSTEDGSIRVEVIPSAATCRGVSLAPYAGYRVHLMGNIATETFAGEQLKKISLNPSGPLDRTYYLVLVKCREKIIRQGESAARKHLFIQDCKHDDPKACITLTEQKDCTRNEDCPSNSCTNNLCEPTDMDKCCGWWPVEKGVDPDCPPS